MSSLRQGRVSASRWKQPRKRLRRPSRKGQHAVVQTGAEPAPDFRGGASVSTRHICGAELANLL